MGFNRIFAAIFTQSTRVRFRSVFAATGECKMIVTLMSLVKIWKSAKSGSAWSWGAAGHLSDGAKGSSIWFGFAAQIEWTCGKLATIAATWPDHCDV